MKKQTSETHFDSGNPPLPGAAPPKPGNALRLALLMGVVVGITLWVHWPVLSAKAISFDDEEAIVHDHLVRHPGLNSVGRFFSEIRGSTAVRGYYLPLSLTSLMVDYNLGGRLDNPRPFHRTSLALHVGSTILLMLLCHQIFRQPWVAALVGLMFGVHPLTVEPVAWIIERMTVLAAFFAFAALNAYVRFAVKGRRRWYALALILFVLALLSKPTSTPLPLIMLLMNYWPLRRFSRQTLLEIVPFLALSVASVVLAVFSEGHTNPLAAPVSNDPGHLLLRLCWLTVFHPFKALVPLRLSSVYDLPEPLSLGNPVVLLAVVTTILLLAALALSARMTRAIWVGAAIFYVALVPTMGFVGITWMVGCDKYVYLPAIGPILVAAWLINGLWSHAKGISLGKQRAATICAALAGAGLLAMCTRGYLQRWKTTDTLLTHMLSLAPRSPSLHSRQGDLHMAVGQYDDAIREFTAAIEGYPGHAEAYYNRGLCFASLGRYASAQRDFTEAIRFRPNYTDAYNNRGNVFSAVGDYERALADYRKAIELEPDRDAAYVNRANVYASAGELDLALRDLAKAIEINSGSQEAYYCRGNVLAMMGDTERAIQDYSRVIKLTPDHVGAYNNRGNAWIAKQDFTRALHDFSR
ncbi:MAG TPA: tetratricopeptide repeat protein, partial [Phycisphaerae bacterium]|nr:tetratricopeptide repeat protein [Phycisphaerae bacterium]